MDHVVKKLGFLLFILKKTLGVELRIRKGQIFRCINGPVNHCGYIYLFIDNFECAFIN